MRHLLVLLELLEVPQTTYPKSPIASLTRVIYSEATPGIDMIRLVNLTLPRFYSIQMFISSRQGSHISGQLSIFTSLAT